MIELNRQFFDIKRKWYITDVEIQILAMAKHIKNCNWLKYSVGKSIENSNIKIPYERLFYISY